MGREDNDRKRVRDIVEELREYAVGSSLPVERELIEKTVSEITRLRAENEKILDGMRDTIRERDILSGENYDRTKLARPD